MTRLLALTLDALRPRVEAIKDWLDGWHPPFAGDELDADLDDWPLTVCVTHRAFIPCRRNEAACWWSEKPEDVAAVSAYQRGDTDA